MLLRTRNKKHRETPTKERCSILEQDEASTYVSVNLASMAWVGCNGSSARPPRLTAERAACHDEQVPPVWRGSGRGAVPNAGQSTRKSGRCGPGKACGTRSVVDKNTMPGGSVSTATSTCVHAVRAARLCRSHVATCTEETSVCCCVCGFLAGLHFRFTFPSSL